MDRCTDEPKETCRHQLGWSLQLTWMEFVTNLEEVWTNLDRVCYQLGRSLLTTWKKLATYLDGVCHQLGRSLIPTWMEFARNKLGRSLPLT